MKKKSYFEIYEDALFNKLFVKEKSFSNAKKFLDKIRFNDNVVMYLDSVLPTNSEKILGLRLSYCNKSIDLYFDEYDVVMDFFVNTSIVNSKIQNLSMYRILYDISKFFVKYEPEFKYYKIQFKEIPV